MPLLSAVALTILVANPPVSVGAFALSQSPPADACALFPLDGMAAGFE